ncbi:AIR carboxylase family protein [Candidatus Nitrotoga sp. BS]|uniref:AIR carboxylase family protein n=1 Tax=Candidatus Nitrotoga sp. BS TaxID=2890408 RepID=UPI001EF1AE13|nr:AIR carboxylase family protein [Candidatus Nitrotoga sp. BS]
MLSAPIPSKHLKSIDSLLSIVQMPKDILAGAANSGLFAITMPAITIHSWPNVSSHSANSRPKQLLRSSCHH